ncbi:uncharacterized protein [Narcine bancroftii]|uniref:uncharacterized protein n=1 Tax=Narcine bancroftii TaxID=1343680 RepID=UPI003831FCFC
MALSQLQCLDEGHINFRTNESKPEFFYSEGQRLAVEALVTGGIRAFNQAVAEENLREFLSELDIQHLLGSVRDFLDDGPPCSREAERPGEQKPVSLHYWPELSDVSRPSLELGWPDCAAYRGVTRANVYTQPPVDGSIHIKEMIRRLIGQAQKVIAVVMDIFTDIDIFKDLLDASFKRKVPVYIIHDEVNIKYFMKMCQNSGMHLGMLKNIRVFTINGTELTTRSAKTVVGRQMQKFLLIDGDRAASGSYSFTWTASRLDRNIITVLSGQAVEIFDKQFRELLHFSKPVNLLQLNLAPAEEPPEPVQQVATLTAEQTAAIAKKLINPKYSLVRVTNAGSTSSEKKVDSNGMGKKQSDILAKAPKADEITEDEFRVHPDLVNMPKVNMFNYLPTYVEVPQEEQKQLKTKERKRETCRRNSLKVHKARENPSVQVRRVNAKTCTDLNVAQVATSIGKEDSTHDLSQVGGDTQEADEELGLGQMLANEIEALKVKEMPNAAVDNEDIKLMEAPSGKAARHKEEEENQTGDNGTMAVDVYSDSPADRLDGEQQVNGLLDIAVREESDEKASESEDGAKGNEPDIDLNIPGEEDLEDDCPSNPSTNCTPEWNTDSSSPHEQSIASSDSGEFYDCACTNAIDKRLLPNPITNQANIEVAIRKENNFISKGSFGKANKFRDLPHSMKDTKECKKSQPKTVEAFFNDQENMRKRALNKLQLRLEINYHDKFQRKRYAMPSKLSATAMRPNVKNHSLQPLHSVSRGSDLSKSRRQTAKPVSSSLLHNYQKIMARQSALKQKTQDGADKLDMAETNSCENSACPQRIFSVLDTPVSYATTPLGLSISKLTTFKNSKLKSSAHKVLHSSGTFQKTLNK